MNIEDLLRDLVMVPGVSGFEEPIRNYLLEKLKDYNPKVDKVGNIYVTVGEGEKNIAVVAHMDEIGIITTYIEDDGYIRFAPVGGVDSRMLYGRIMEIFSENRIVYGIIGLIPPHLSTEEERKKTPTWKELAIDIGANSREDAIKIGIMPMLPGRWKKDFVVMGNYIVTRGLDDRAGCAVLISLIEKLKKKKLNKKVTFIWTIQEETGLRGALAISSVLRFDEVYVIDTMTSGMMPGVQFHLSPAKIGEGPVIRLVDRKGIASQELRRKVLEIAKNNGIPIQEAITGGTTDASVIFERGMNSLPICIPVKYTHSPVEMMHLADLKNTIELLEKIAMD